MSADRALARLRDADDPALSDLVAIALKAFDDVPLGAVVDVDSLAKHGRRAVHHLASTPEARARALEVCTKARAEARTSTTPARDLVPAEAQAVVRTVLAQPWAPSEDLTYAVINHDAVRTLVREVLQGAMSKLVHRLRQVDQGSLGGVGGKVVKRGKGLFGGVAGGLGAAAEGLMGTVRDEITATLDARMRETLGAATDEAIRGIAAWVADPAHAEPVAALRISILDLVLDLPIGELVQELDEVSNEAVVDAVFQGLREAAARDDLEAELHGTITRAIAPWADERLGTWLDALALREVWSDASDGLITPLARRVVHTEEFGTWWSSLLS